MVVSSLINSFAGAPPNTESDNNTMNQTQKDENCQLHIYIYMSALLTVFITPFREIASTLKLLSLTVYFPLSFPLRLNFTEK